MPCLCSVNDRLVESELLKLLQTLQHNTISDKKVTIEETQATFPIFSETVIGCAEWAGGGLGRVKFQRREQHCGSITAGSVAQTLTSLTISLKNNQIQAFV